MFIEKIVFKKIAVIMGSAIINPLKSGKNYSLMELLAKLENCDWKDFEQIISEVFETHNYKSFWNVNLTINGKRWQFDVVSVKNAKHLLIECKKWGNKKSRLSALRNAAVKHKEKCGFYKEFVNQDVLPVIIIYNDECVKELENVYVVPLNKLNDFILGLP